MKKLYCVVLSMRERRVDVSHSTRALRRRWPVHAIHRVEHFVDTSGRFTGGKVGTVVDDPNSDAPLTAREQRRRAARHIEFEVAT